MKKFDYDIIIIGGGGAGITSATLAAGLGKRVAMIDKGRFGGECTWTGCVPSKALLQSAKISHTIKYADKFGLLFPQKLSMKYAGVMESVRSTVKAIYEGEKPAHFQNAGIRAIENASVHFIDPNTIEVNGNLMTSNKFIIATGSSPFIPPVHGLDTIDYYTNESIFSIKKLPGSMAVMGGGPIGVELAMAFNRLGVKISLIEMAGNILPREDAELSDILKESIIKEGISLLTGSKVVRIEKKNKIIVHYEINGMQKKVSADTILVAVGRKPNVDGLGLDKAGVEYNTKGITVNKKLQTSAGNIYAAGDVAGPYQFSHMANYQAIIAASNALLPINKKVNYDNVPWCTFTDPEFARSGLTEQEARDKFGHNIKVYRSRYENIDRAKTDKTETGLAKIVCKKNGQILGIHILGERAGELMQELHLAKYFHIPLHRLNFVIHAYPAYSDLILKAAREAYVYKIQNNLFIKLISKFRSYKKK